MDPENNLGPLFFYIVIILPAAEIFDKIWLFVEQKVQAQVPTYIKYVLKACGYENDISISSIEHDDIQYFIEQVKNGNVSNYFKSNICEEDLLKGSGKTVENFEFNRGHIKFLMYIVEFLKKYIEENGSVSLSVEAMSKPDCGIKRPTVETSLATSKRIKLSSNESPETLLNVGLKAQEGILLNKIVMSLITHAPEIYVKHFHIINKRILAINFIGVKKDKSLNESTESLFQYAARIICPFCSNIISLAGSHEGLSNGSSGDPRWNMSIFDDHVKFHQNNRQFENDENFRDIGVFEDDEPALNQALNIQDQLLLDSERFKTMEGSGLLWHLVNAAERNCTRKKQGYRHDDLIKAFMAYIKMTGGLLTYETLHANLPLSVPSVSTVNRHISDNGPQIVEGDMRTDDLLKYLQNRNLPLRVSLSEDGTRITPKVSYDPNTNQLIGFALPFDENGMPIKFSFQARNVSEIKGHFSNQSNFISSTAYVQMAQPMEENSPPFCLMMFLTDCKFTSYNILKRWQFQATTLKEKGITIENISSDGDARPLLVKKCLSRIGIQDLTYLDCEWFSCGGYVETTFTQDCTHILTKLRNRILKYSRIYPIGNKVISSSYLKYLIDHVSKDKHLLNYSDVEPKDRQNFLSAEKLCSDKTIQCLLEFVPGSEGTVLYLKAMNSVLKSYLNIEIKSEQRIYLMWYAVFFFRAWRSWLLNSEKSKTSSKGRLINYYNLKENFISSNCYTCIELNAHALVKKVLDKHDFNRDNSKTFFPNEYGSQPCESMFRQVRSFTSTFSTVVNCNMLDIIHRVKKIQFQNDIISDYNSEIKFPRFQQKLAIASDRRDSYPFKGLSRSVVINEIENARKAVICDMVKLGIDTAKLNFHCQIKPVFERDITENDCDLDPDDSDCEEIEQQNELEVVDIDDVPEEDIQKDVNLLSGVTGDLELRDYSELHSDGKIHLNEESPFVVVVDNKGKEMVVRKSSICWLLSKNKYKLSSDRLQRVQEKEYSNTTEKKSTLSADFVKNAEVSIGEWCIFQGIFSENVDESSDDSILIGLVLGFSYLRGRTFKEREFSKSVAPVESNHTIGVLCTPYTFNGDGELLAEPGHKHKYIEIESYKGTIRNPIYVNAKLSITENLLKQLNGL